MTGPDFEAMFESIRRELSDLDIEFDFQPGDFDAARVKAFAFIPELIESLKEMAGAPRDQVVMVRLDQESTRELDDWVKAGAVKSRSEAAALFIREGLRLRAGELHQLRDALDDVQAAQERLRQKAGEIFGDDDEPPSMA
ncbi:MAG: ribbon-helix-helix domain-containing protein [Acidimicrobiia bacterium]|nr:ribbon-helix-helix domain-containing protein [Acidimicrobiia bacterium]